jgi:putative intracellular protease/amidase
MATMLVPLANGVEEMEAVIVIDVLRRAGWTVIVAATGETLTVTASRGVRIQADIHWREIADHLEVAAGIVIAGGAEGVGHLCENQRHHRLHQTIQTGRPVDRGDLRRFACLARSRNSKWAPIYVLSNLVSQNSAC